MNKKATTILLLLILKSNLILCQVSTNEHLYNGFASRSFMKFNQFLTIPTFSLLYENHSSISGFIRNTNVAFNDSPRLYLLTYYGKVQENIGVGLVVYQQQLGAFRDIGGVLNYGHQLQIGDNSNLTFGFNLMYSRRSALVQKILAETTDRTLQNFQDIPAINFQPTVTLSFGKIAVGVYFENLLDYNLKEEKMITSFSDKIIVGYGVYSYVFENLQGLFKGATIRLLAIGKKQPKSFGYGANIILDIPYIGWLKGAYNKTYGYQVGLGMNVSKNIAIGFSYEKHPVLGGTNEVGITYNFRNRTPKNRSNVNFSNKNEQLTGKNTKLIEQLSNEVEQSQDSINKLNKEIDKMFKILQNNTTHKKSKKNNDESIAYYIVTDKFKNLQELKNKIKDYEEKGINVKGIKDKNLGNYYLYVESYKDSVKATRLKNKINSNNNQFWKSKLLQKSVYVVKIIEGIAVEYKPTKIEIKKIQVKGVEKGYYLRVHIFSQKSNADKFLKKLEDDNIKGNFFIEPSTGYRHVYIYKTDSKLEIVRMYNNNLQGKYYDMKIIVKVE